MNLLATVFAVILLLFVGVQTHHSATVYNVSLTCVASGEENSECLSLGRLGGVSRSGVGFWASSFVEHTIDLPWTLRDVAQKFTMSGTI